MRQLFNTFLQDEQGQDLVEYALLLAFIALAAITTLSGLKSTINTMFVKVNSTLTSVTPP